MIEEVDVLKKLYSEFDKNEKLGMIFDNAFKEVCSFSNFETAFTILLYRIPTYHIQVSQEKDQGQA